MLTGYKSPRLLADIGGTYARFTLETAPGVFERTGRRFEREARIRAADVGQESRAVEGGEHDFSGCGKKSIASPQRSREHGDSQRNHWISL